MPGRPWTTYDWEFVRLTYGAIPVTRIAEHLDRTVVAIYRYNQTHHVRRPSVLEVLPPPSHHAPPWIPGRGTPARPRRAQHAA